MDSVALWIGVIADAVTICVGVGTVVLFLWNRRRIESAVRVLLNKIFMERASRLRETTARLSKLSFDDKAHRKEILALIGQARGQMKPFVLQHPAFNEPYLALDDYLKSPSTLSEPRKRELIAVIDGAIESAFVGAANPENLHE